MVSLLTLTLSKGVLPMIVIKKNTQRTEIKKDGFLLIKGLSETFAIVRPILGKH